MAFKGHFQAKSFFDSPSSQWISGLTDTCPISVLSLDLQETNSRKQNCWWIGQEHQQVESTGLRRF